MQKNLTSTYTKFFYPRPPPPPEQKWVETGLQCKNFTVYGKSENSQDYAQEPERNCTSMNSASGVEWVRYRSCYRIIPQSHVKGLLAVRVKPRKCVDSLFVK